MNFTCFQRLFSFVSSLTVVPSDVVVVLLSELSEWVSKVNTFILISYTYTLMSPTRVLHQLKAFSLFSCYESYFLVNKYFCDQELANVADSHKI